MTVRRNRQSNDLKPQGNLRDSYYYSWSPDFCSSHKEGLIFYSAVIITMVDDGGCHILREGAGGNPNPQDPDKLISKLACILVQL